MGLDFGLVFDADLGNYLQRPNLFSYQAVDLCVSAVKLNILTWGLMKIDSLGQVVIRGNAIFSTSMLASGFRPGGCCLDLTQDFVT